MEFADTILSPVFAVAAFGYLATFGALEARLRFLYRAGRTAEAPPQLIGFTPATNVGGLTYVLFGKLPGDFTTGALALAARLCVVVLLGGIVVFGVMVTRALESTS